MHLNASKLAWSLWGAEPETNVSIRERAPWKHLDVCIYVYPRQINTPTHSVPLTTEPQPEPNGLNPLAYKEPLEPKPKALNHPKLVMRPWLSHLCEAQWNPKRSPGNCKRKFDSSGVVTRVKRADGSVAVCLDVLEQHV